MVRVVKKGTLNLYKTNCSVCSAEYDEITMSDIENILSGEIRPALGGAVVYQCPNCLNSTLTLESYTHDPENPKELDSDNILRLNATLRVLNFRLDRIKEVLSQEENQMKNDPVSGETILYVSSLIGRIDEHMH